MMLVLWEVTNTSDQMANVFHAQLKHPMFVDDLNWVIEKSNTKKKRWLLGTFFAQRLYFITDGEFVKMGIVTSPKSRLESLQVGNPRDLKLLYAGRTSNARHQENHLHKKFKHLHVRGEWFRYTDEIDKQIAQYKANEDYFESRLIDVTLQQKQINAS